MVSHRLFWVSDPVLVHTDSSPHTVSPVSALKDPQILTHMHYSSASHPTGVYYVKKHLKGSVLWKPLASVELESCYRFLRKSLSCKLMLQDKETFSAKTFHLYLMPHVSSEVVLG